MSQTQDEQQTRWEDRATQLVICEMLRLAMFQAKTKSGIRLNVTTC